MSFPLNLGSNSLGSQVNRLADSLGLPTQLGDLIGATVDLQTGNLPGALRNLVDLQSHIPSSTLQQAGVERNAAFGRGFLPRPDVFGHRALRAARHCFPRPAHVGTDARPGQLFVYHRGNHTFLGRISNEQYSASMNTPVHLPNGKVLLHGRMYDNMKQVWRDLRDGILDGWSKFGPIRPFPGIPGGQGAGAADGTGSPAPAGGASGSSGAEGDKWGELERLMQSGAPLETILMALMSTISKDVKEQINNKIKKYQENMKKQNAASKEGGQGNADPNFNPQVALEEINQLVRQLEQLMNMCTNMLKSMNEMSMATVRNMRA